VLRQLPRWVGVTLIAGLTIWVSGSILWSHRPSGLTLAQVQERLTSPDVAGLQALVARSTPSGQSFLLMGLVVVLVASLIVGIRCSGAISGAREGQTWEALLLTPLETSQLVRGKLRGIMAASVPYLLAYAVPAVVLAPFGGFMALFWLVLCLAVTALAMYFVGAAGIWCSARFKSSWKSLLGTLGLGYVGGFLVCAAVASPVIAILTIIILVVLHLIDTFYGTQVVKRFRDGLHRPADRLVPGAGGQFLRGGAVRAAEVGGKLGGHARTHPPLEGRTVPLGPAPPRAIVAAELSVGTRNPRGPETQRKRNASNGRGPCRPFLSAFLFLLCVSGPLGFVLIARNAPESL